MDMVHGVDLAAAIQISKMHEVFTNATVAAAIFKHKLIVYPVERGISVKIIFGTRRIRRKGRWRGRLWRGELGSGGVPLLRAHGWAHLNI